MVRSGSIHNTPDTEADRLLRERIIGFENTHTHLLYVNLYVLVHTPHTPHHTRAHRHVGGPHPPAQLQPPRPRHHHVVAAPLPLLPPPLPPLLGQLPHPTLLPPLRQHSPRLGQRRLPAHPVAHRTRGYIRCHSIRCIPGGAAPPPPPMPLVGTSASATGTAAACLPGEDL